MQAWLQRRVQLPQRLQARQRQTAPGSWPMQKTAHAGGAVQAALELLLHALPAAAHNGVDLLRAGQAGGRASGTGLGVLRGEFAARPAPAAPRSRKASLAAAHNTNRTCTTMQGSSPRLKGSPATTAAQKARCAGSASAAPPPALRSLAVRRRLSRPRRKSTCSGGVRTKVCLQLAALFARTQQRCAGSTALLVRSAPGAAGPAHAASSAGAAGPSRPSRPSAPSAGTWAG